MNAKEGLMVHIQLKISVCVCVYIYTCIYDLYSLHM